MHQEVSLMDCVPNWESDDPTPALDSPPESLLVTGSAIAAGVMTRKVLKGLWTRVRGSDPPNNPAQPDVTWTEALTWAAAVGAAVGVSRVLSRRGTTAAVNRLSSKR